MVRASGRRRRAEESVLRLILAEPSLALEAISLDDEPRSPLERFSEFQFEDPPCRLAWRMVAEGAAAGQVPDGSDIVATIEDVGLSRILAGCFAEGYREIRDADARPDGDPRSLLSDACRDLAAAIDRDIVLAERADLASQPVQSVADAAAALDRLRAAGSDPAAIRQRREGRLGGRFTTPAPESDSSPPAPPPDIDSSFDPGSA